MSDIPIITNIEINEEITKNKNDNVIINKRKIVKSI